MNQKILWAVIAGLVIGVLLAAICGSQVMASNSTYGCFLTYGEVFWEGHAHPAAFDLQAGPTATGFSIATGPVCDDYPSRADYADRRYSFGELPTPTPVPPTPTPIPTATPMPTPVPTPEPAVTPTPTSTPSPTPESAMNVCADPQVFHLDHTIHWFVERGEYPCGFSHPKWGGLSFVYGGDDRR